MLSEAFDGALKKLAAKMPDLYMQHTDLDWSLKQPCADCPFLKTSPYHQGVAESIPAMIDSIQNQTFAHTCHKTDCRETVDGPRTYTGKTKVCAGSVMMLLRTGKGMDLQLPLLQAAERGELDLVDMTRRARQSKTVFTLFGLLEFYAEKLARRMRSKRKR